MSEIKQSLPLITGSNDVYEHIFNIKLEVKSLKEEITKFSAKFNIESVDGSLKNGQGNENAQKKSLRDEGLGNK